VNIAAWLLAGAVAAWFACSLLKFNVRLGLRLSLVIGASGGVLGGAFLGPLLGAAAVNPGDFNPPAFFAAIATGMASVIVSDMIENRFGT
jgi:uncharacterized membrane protein YeaQ/YmgE (transglycosylase-associated protein family)